MPDPKAALQDLEALLSWPENRWAGALAGCGMGLPNPAGVQAGRAALKHALVNRTTPQDVLARMGRDVRSATLDHDVRRTALDFCALARGVARRRVELAFDDRLAAMGLTFQPVRSVVQSA